jgi:hypothetical protein
MPNVPDPSDDEAVRRALAIGQGVAQHYTPAELDAVRDVIERYNGPDSPQRRLLATLDAVLADKDDR